ncbi:MAG TPA: PBP1A family penicillin-binding protein [Marinospirillum sp.]|uniref:penicillin-binding protein 1A n=1 Tax=Marinospirillum sp. TaxID=2183934 RepID=UPI002B490684|nr:PBP1A family penicillin-binding protein [Marinospirillum sp.]HKM16559.1 PBP1A family penicillin-binding protein [Marinospirillum sp.]
MRLFKNILKFFFWLGLAGAGLGGLWAFAIVVYYWPSLHEEVSQLQDMESLLSEQLEVPMRVYTADNLLVAEFGEHRRTRINYQDIPKRYIDALLAAEDTSFYEHPGVDIKGLARAAVQLVDSGRIQSGGSTITMQVTRNYLLTRDRTFARKIREILLSLRLEQQLSKQQILELYVNKIYLGNRAYGISAAAEVYYGKPLKDLNLAQLAMIAGLPKAPSAYNPIVNPRRALIRRNWILSRMYHLNLLDDISYEAAIRAPVTARYYPPEQDIDAPFVAENARQFALETFGDKAYTRGLKVYTSIISEQQLAANQAIKDGLLNYDKRRGWRGVEREAIPLVAQQEALEGDALAEIEATESGLEQVQLALQDPVARKLQAQLGKDVSNWLKVLANTPVYGDLQPAIVVEAESKRLLVLKKGGELIELTPAAWDWAGRYHSPFWKDRHALTGNRLAKQGDLIRLQRSSANQQPWQLAQLPALEAALVAMKTETGEITAMVGGFDFNQSHFNRADQAARQAGSIFKPFVYMAALEKGYTPATIINDAPVVFEDQQLEDAWRPQNSTGTFYGPTRLREGLYKSRNLISIRVLNYIGIGQAIDYISRFGFSADRMPRNLSLALGSANVTPVEMTRAYAMLANGGYPVEAHLVTRIESFDGEVLYRAVKPKVCRNCPADQPNINLAGVTYPLSKSAVDERAVYTMHSILRDVIDDGTGSRAKALDRSDIRGKTGTTNELHDAWFSGFNSDLVTTVWAGFDQPSSTGEYGANLALPMWIKFMEVALKNKPESAMARPEGLVTVRIDPTNGLLASPGQQNAMFETFYRERVPEDYSFDNLLQNNFEEEGELTTPNNAPPPEALF